MAEPGRNPPKSPPLPVSGAPKKGILVGGGKPVAKPSRSPATPAAPAPVAQPAPPRRNHGRAVLTGLLFLLIAAAVFVAGMEIGYRRADSRYEPVVKELNEAAKRHAEALHARDQQLALLIAKAKSPPAKEPAAPAAKEALASAVPKVKNSALAEMLTQGATASEGPKAAPKKETPTQVAKAAIPEPVKPVAGLKQASFAQDILPIFKAKCFTCHGDGKKKGGLDLRTLESTTRGGNSGSGVVAGKHENSAVWEWVADDRMPPSKNKLTAAEKARVRDWILQGGK